MGCICCAKLLFAVSSASLCKGKGWRNGVLINRGDGLFRRRNRIQLQLQLGATSIIAGGAEEHLSQPIIPGELGSQVGSMSGDVP